MIIYEKEQFMNIYDP